MGMHPLFNLLKVEKAIVIAVISVYMNYEYVSVEWNLM